MLTLPSDVESDKIEAKVENGVLNVLIPKKKQEELKKPLRQISIH